jgi:LacI family transcriptional regulator
MLGLSKATVSRALNESGRVSQTTRRRVLAVLEQSGFTPSTAARALSTGRSGLVALVIGRNRNPNALSVIEAAAREVSRHGLNVVVSATASEEPREQLDLFRGKAVDGGILLFPPAAEADIWSELARAGASLVAIEPEVPIDGVASIYGDAHSDGLRVTQLLTGLGHRRIGLGLDRPGWGEQDRLLEGYDVGLARHGLTADDDLVKRFGWDFRSGERMAAEWLTLASPPTAVIFCCDTAALGGLACLTRMGVKVPGDVSIVSYDDTDVLTWVSPSITALRDRRRSLSVAACRSLVTAMNGGHVPSVRRIPTGLVVRESTMKRSS